MNTPIARQILDPLLVATYMEEATCIGSFGHRGLAFSLFTNPTCDGSLLVQIEGLGHTLHILYKFDEVNSTQPAIADVGMFYSDFCDFVLYEREEQHATKH